MVFAESDIHLNPGTLLLDRKGYKGTYVLVGDILNILPHGFSPWQTPEGRQTIESIDKNTPDDVWYVIGNHEGRLSWIKKLFSPYPKWQGRIVRRLDMEIDGRVYHFEHGHKFTEWWVLRHIADDWVEFVTTLPIIREWWYKFCIYQGWIPSKAKNPLRTYSVLLGIYWGMVVQRAMREGRSWVVGHSHTRMSWSSPHFGVEVFDLGAGIPNVISHSHL